MNIKKIMLCAACATLISLNCISQDVNSSGPQPGDQMPDVVFNDIHYYSKKSARLSDFRGKWLILDLWSTGCIACFRAFPKVNELQKKFSDKLQFVLVGPKDSAAKKSYDKFSKHYHLTLPVAYDSSLFRLLNVTTVPRIIAIDPSGTYFNELLYHDVNEQMLTALASGKKPQIYPLIIGHSSSYYPDLPEQVIRFSKLEKSKPGQAGFVPEFEWPHHWSIYNKKGIAFRGTVLNILFRVVYFGKFFCSPLDNGWYGKYAPDLVLEGVDSALIKADRVNNKNVYDYTFMTNDSTIGSQQLQELVQEDLNQQFPFVVTNEWRMTPYYRVSIDRETAEKLESRGGDPYYPPRRGDAITGLSLRNIRIGYLFDYIYSYHQLDTLFIDETGITGNVDVYLDAVLTDRESIKQGLRKLGFTVDLQYKRMHTLVVRPRRSRDEANRQ